MSFLKKIPQVGDDPRKSQLKQRSPEAAMNGEMMTARAEKRGKEKTDEQGFIFLADF